MITSSMATPLCWKARCYFWTRFLFTTFQEVLFRYFANPSNMIDANFILYFPLCYFRDHLRKHAKSAKNNESCIEGSQRVRHSDQDSVPEIIDVCDLKMAMAIRRRIKTEHFNISIFVIYKIFDDFDHLACGSYC